MKKFNFDKFMKYVGIAAIIALILLYSQKRSDNSAKQREDIYSTIITASEELYSISSDCFEAHNSGVYDEMLYALYDAYSRLDTVSNTLENLSYKFQDHEDDYDGRRSWFY